ncbi:hypothetical protein Tco_0723837, partial [Tanacetum coccineum]
DDEGVYGSANLHNDGGVNGIDVRGSANPHDGGVNGIDVGGSVNVCVGSASGVGGSVQGHAGKTNVITAENISALTYALYEFPGGSGVRRIIQA